MTRRVVSLMIFSGLVLWPAGPAVCSGGTTSLKGACAKVNITPPLGIPLIGSRGQPSDAVMDELYAKAMVLDDGRTAVALVSVDLLYAPLEEITDPVREIIEQRTGIPKRNVMVFATHTHSGPEVFARSKVPREGRLPASQIDRSYLQVVVNKVAGAVLVAHRNMQEVRIGAATGRLPEIVYNRRPGTEDGRVQMAFTLPPEVTVTRRTESGRDGATRVTFDFPDQKQQLSFGPVDPDVFVLRAEDTTGGMVGALIGFGCHPVCIYPYESTAISADYPGHATHLIEQAEGGTCLFALGLAGDAVPLRRGVEPCEQIGRAVGGEALRRLQFVTTTSDVALSAGRKEITLPTKKPSSATDAVEADAPGHVTTELQVLRLGDIYILGLPGEVLIEVGLEIKRRAGVEHLFIVTLANDAIGYVCHRDAYEEGGYEPGSGTNLAPGAGEMMADHALALINEIKR